MRKLFIYFFSLFLILLMLGFFYFLKVITYTNVITGKNIDGIAILTGGKGRIDSGLNLFTKQSDIRLIISGVDKKVSINSVLPSKLQENNRIYIDQVSESTFENALVITEWAKKNQLHSINVITSYYHMPRSMLLLNKFAENINYYAYPVKKEKSKTSKLLPDMIFALFLTQEYIKYLLSYIVIMLYS
jgi:uncharacterized SAM-binding protein YcdF (DUF218 family)